MSEHDDTTQDDVLFWSRFQHILDTSMAALSPDQVKQGLAEIERTGRPGVHVQEADDSGERVALIWGGMTIATVNRRVFSDEAYFQGLDFTTEHGSSE